MQKGHESGEEMLLLLDSSNSDFSSDEDTLESLYLELSFKPKVVLHPRLNLADLLTLECEQLSRLD